MSELGMHDQQRVHGILLDPTLRLALAMYHNKGCYALLLGSGLSRSASIPTGWEVLLDLVRKLAAGMGEPCEPDEEAWYRRTFDEKPTYDALMERLTTSSAERAHLMRTYIEPEGDELGDERKVPQAAHKAIGRLVASGYVRLIVTTNFDHLLEDGMRALGVEPSIVDSPEAVERALPLVHERCTIIKVHGDYTNTSVLNTADELASYGARMTQLLSRVFSDFGLVICGWSGESDVALRDVMKNNASTAFHTYWATPTDLSTKARELLDARQSSTMIHVADADIFFQDLEDKVVALENIEQSRRLSARVAAAELKRHLAGPQKDDIRVHDLVLEEAERVYEAVESGYTLASFTAQEVVERFTRYEGVSKPLAAMLMTLCYWDAPEQGNLCGMALQRVVEVPVERNVNNALHVLGLYPAVVLLYACGVGALLRGTSYHQLGSLARVPTPVNTELLPLSVAAFAEAKLSRVLTTHLPDVRTNAMWLSQHIRELLNDVASAALIERAGFDDTYDLVEYLLGLIYTHLWNTQHPSTFWGPVGSFARHTTSSGEIQVVQRVRDNLNVGGYKNMLAASVCDGDRDRLQTVMAEYDELVHSQNARWHLGF